MNAGSEHKATDYYDYIDSRDVREHLRAVGFHLSPRDAAYLAAESRRLSVAERRAAWAEIMRGLGDCAFGRLVSEAVERDEALLAELSAPGAHAFQCVCRGEDGETVETRRGVSLAECVSLARGAQYTEISRRTPGGGHVHGLLDGAGRVMRLSGDGRIADGFERLAFEFPSPFTEGERLRVVGGEGIFARAELKYLGCRFEPGLGMLADCEYVNALGETARSGQLLLRLERRDEDARTRETEPRT
ncbi:MAG: hypothetical protein IK101_04315 [Oscillospiraceae bacterium]|nr:hypothetical protein [Oscillospiraceae bacterium]